jgi:hypothetical protein
MQNEASAKLHVHEHGVDVAAAGIFSSGVHDLFAHKVHIPLLGLVINSFSSAISGFRRHADEICALLGHYAALSGSSVSTFQDNLSIASSRVKKWTS